MNPYPTTVLFAAALLAAPLSGQMQDNQEKSLTCDNHSRNGRLVSHCEIQEQTAGVPRGSIQIDAGENGGIAVKGWSRNDILVRARIDTAAVSDTEARAMVGQIRVASGGGLIKADGPSRDNDHNWSVSYEIFVPHQADITAKAHNGGIRIQDIKGRIDFHSTNGGAHLSRLAGNVTGQTTNGGLTIELAGDRWDGQGIDVATTNGGVKLHVPANYSAHVETATVNGGTHVDFPLTVSGKMGKDLSFNIGSGGSTIRAVTTNGGIHIQKS